MDDPKRTQRRKKYLEQKYSSVEYIRGNVRADALAEQGTRRHLIDVDVLLHATDRADLMTHVQQHLVLSWSDRNQAHGRESREQGGCHIAQMSELGDPEADFYDEIQAGLFDAGPDPALAAFEEGVEEE